MERVGPWRLDGRLGIGGMGTVYHAHRDSDDAVAALKVIRPEHEADPGFRARFAREVEACSRVHGPRVAELMDADVTGPEPWLAVRYVPGPTLAEHVATHGPLSDDGTRALAVGLADALQVIWAADVIHRDLKPSNVILTPDGPVVIDFGIATAAEATAITASGVTVGSAGWMAPDQLQGGTVAEPADVWGWAAIVLYTATGTGPFGEGRPEALAWRSLHTEPDPQLLDQLPATLRPPVTRALTPDPQARPDPATLPALAAGHDIDEPTTIAATRPDREALVTRLWDLPAVQPTTIAPLTPPPTRRRTRRRNVIVATTAIVLLALAIGSAAYALLSDGDDDGDLETAQEDDTDDITPNVDSENSDGGDATGDQETEETQETEGNDGTEGNTGEADTGNGDDRDLEADEGSGTNGATGEAERFCSDMMAVDVSDPTNLSEAQEAASDITPPDEIADAWNQWMSISDESEMDQDALNQLNRYVVNNCMDEPPEMESPPDADG